MPTNGEPLRNRRVRRFSSKRGPLQHLQPVPTQRKTGRFLRELGYRTTGALRRHLLWRKLLRTAGMLIALLGLPMETAWAEPLHRIDWRSACETQFCSQAPQAGPEKVIIDLGRALAKLKELMRSPYEQDGKGPGYADLTRESRLRFNLNISTEQPGLELVYRF